MIGNRYSPAPPPSCRSPFRGLRCTLRSVLRRSGRKRFDGGQHPSRVWTFVTPKRTAAGVWPMKAKPEFGDYFVRVRGLALAEENFTGEVDAAARHGALVVTLSNVMTEEVEHDE